MKSMFKGIITSVTSSIVIIGTATQNIIALTVSLIVLTIIIILQEKNYNADKV